MDKNEIKELNKFLKGIHMGGATFKDFIEKSKSDEVKRELISIEESFKRHEEAITHRIEALGGNAADTLGIVGEMAEFWEKIKLISVNTDMEVCDKAIEAIEMGIKNSNKFIDENKNIENSIMNDIKGVVSDYNNHLQKIKSLRENL